MAPETLERFRRGAFAGQCRLGRRAGHAPFPGHQKYRLGEIERGEIRVERRLDDGGGKAHLIVVEAAAFRAEQHARPRARGPQQPGRLARAADRLFHIAPPRCRRQDQLQVRDRFPGRVEDARAVDHRIRPGRGRPRRRVGPAVARRHKAQLVQAAIQHRARRHADILAELRAHQDDSGPAAHRSALSSL